MKVMVYQKSCIQCGLCASVCPEVFTLLPGQPAQAPGGGRGLPHRCHRCPIKLFPFFQKANSIGESQRRQVTFAAGKTVGKLKAVVRLDTLHLIASANENFLLTPGAKSDTLNALQAMMGVAARSCGRKCPPVGTVTAVECGSFPNSGGTTDYDLVRPELRRQFRAFFYFFRTKKFLP